MTTTMGTIATSETYEYTRDYTRDTSKSGAGAQCRFLNQGQALPLTRLGVILIDLYLYLYGLYVYFLQYDIVIDFVRTLISVLQLFLTCNTFYNLHYNDG